MDFLHQAQQLVEREDFRRLTPEQQQISEQEIAPFIHQIRGDVIAIRKNLDSEIEERRKAYKGETPHESRIGRYPIGQCKYIRDKVLSTILGNTDLPGLQAIQKYSNTPTSVIKPVWGIQYESNFQNTIQVGGFSIDAALDTVTDPEPKILVTRIEECGVRNVRNFIDYAVIAENYWEDNMYPNLYLPQLAPLFPSIVIGKNGEIQLGSRLPCIIGKNVLSQGKDVGNFQDAFDFIFDSPFTQKRLPEKYVDKLGNLVRSIPLENHITRTSLPHFIEDGSPYATEVAFHQRIAGQNYGAYFDVANLGLVKPINQARLAA